MGEWRRPEFLWRAALVAILVLAGLIFLPPQSAVPSSSELELTVPLPAPSTSKQIALTFDDGPRRSTTAELLDGLEARQAKATFFLIGAQAAMEPDLVIRMAREGHQVGVHTYDHVLTTELSHQAFIQQVEGTRRVLYELLGEREFWLRPPYGILNENVKRWADSPIVLWSIDPEDWKDDDVQRITQHILNRAGEGDIILMHDIYPSSVEAALTIVDALQQEGYEFVTVAELLNSRGISPEIGCVYKNAF